MFNSFLKLIDENAFCISDNHFGHDSINKYQPTRLEVSNQLGFGNDTERMMIDLWNETVKDDDIILYMGDMILKDLHKYLPLLNGRKFLILGNHDKKSITSYRKYFEFVFDGLYFEHEGDFSIHKKTGDKLFSGLIKNIGGKKILFSHYPVFSDAPHDLRNEKITSRVEVFRKYHRSQKCTFNFHGHTHDKETGKKNHINVSCEALSFKPKRISDLLSDYQQKNINSKG